MLRAFVYAATAIALFALGFLAGRLTAPLPFIETEEPPLAQPVEGPFKPRPPKPPPPEPPLPEPETGDLTPRERVLFGRFREMTDAINSRAEAREARRDARTEQQIGDALVQVSEYDPERIQAGGFWAAVAAKLWEWVKKAVTKIVETIFKAKVLDEEWRLAKQAAPYAGGAVLALFGAMWGIAKLTAGKKPA